MRYKSNYFLGLTLLTAALFVFTCFSIIFAVINMKNIPDDKRAENFMAFAYLFLHLIFLSAAFYYALKSYLVKDQILSVFMTFENGTKNPKAYKNTLIVAIVFGVFGIFFFLNAFSIIHLTSFFSNGLNLALTNVGLSVSLISLYMHFYIPQVREVDVKNIK